MPLRGKCFPAALDWTHERLLTGVDPLMSFEIASLCEGFPATRKLADKRLMPSLTREIIGQW
jgi:hypothetical protein